MPILGASSSHPADFLGDQDSGVFETRPTSEATMPATKEQDRPEVIHRLNVFQTQDGVQHLQAVRTVSECGCKFKGGGTCQQPLEIVHCPMHAAATDAHKIL